MRDKRGIMTGFAFRVVCGKYNQTGGAMFKKFLIVFMGGLSLVTLVACGGGGGSSSSSGSSTSGGSSGGKVSCTSPAPDHSCIEFVFSGSVSSYSGTGAAYFYDSVTSAADGATVCALLNNTTSNSSGTQSSLENPCESNQTQGTGCASAGSIGYCSFNITGNDASATISNSTWNNL